MFLRMANSSYFSKFIETSTLSLVAGFNFFSNDLVVLCFHTTKLNLSSCYSVVPKCQDRNTAPALCYDDQFSQLNIIMRAIA
jgi:hypothetical protein